MAELIEFFMWLLPEWVQWTILVLTLLCAGIFGIVLLIDIIFVGRDFEDLDR